MPHGNTSTTKATAQNAATPEQQPNDDARGQHVTVHPEPSTYAASDVRDSTLAAPAAGEMGDYADLEAPSGGMAQGRRPYRPRDARSEPGPGAQDARREQGDVADRLSGPGHAVMAVGDRTGPSSSPAETGAGLPDEAVVEGELAPGELDKGSDKAVERLRETGWAGAGSAKQAPADSDPAI